MRLALHFIVLSLYVFNTQSSFLSDIKDNVVSYLRNSDNGHKAAILDFKEEIKKDGWDKKVAGEKALKIKKSKSRANKKKYAPHSVKPMVYKRNGENGKQVYVKDPILNMMARRNIEKRKRITSALTSTSSSSSLELPKWKEAWKEDWIQKKFEAINSTDMKGDSVNMLAARPWGVACGDPNQHDMPWGSCMLPVECEPEFRIYRGDYFCGRTQFVCCALQLTTYDLYQGFDPSFEDSELSTDSAEVRDRNMGSKERARKRKAKEKRRRKKERMRRKRKIKRNIRKIVKEIRKILSRAYRNGTTARKRKTKQLKKFIKDLKKQYKKDRHAVRDIHMLELEKIDVKLQKHIDNIKGMNRNFVANSTFRDIVVNGTVSPAVARMLQQKYPQLSYLVDTRRLNSEQVDKSDASKSFDVEYGLLYY